MYDVNTECVNTIGSHSCSCKAGFTGNGKKCVGKFVKWLSLLPVVIHFKTKQNQNNPGLIWTLGWKLLYDRLELSPKQCHVQLHMRRDAFANNSHFRSTLALKFKPFSFLCILSDVDECANKSHDCDVNAYCNNTVGSYRCTCNSWYQGNGTSCYFREFN